MIKNLENISETKKRLTVEIPADVIEQKIKQELTNLGRKARVPGFRPGKAPISLLEKRFGDEVEADVLNKIVPEYYAKSMKEAKLSPVSHPQFEKSDHEKKKPLEMTFTVEVLPEIKDLDYEGIEVTAEEPVVTDEELEVALKRIQAERMSYESVDRPAENSDLVTIDFAVVEDGKEEKEQIIKIGSDQFPKELSAEIEGKNAGERFEVKLTFPDDHPSEFKGRTVTFKGVLKEVKILKLPDIDENLAHEAGFESLSSLQDSLRADMKHAKENQNRKKQIVELIEKLVESHDVPVPEGMLEAELSSLLTFEKRKDENKDKSDDELKEKMRPEALKNGKAAVLLNIIGEKEHIEVTEEEMKEKILELSQMTQIPPQNLIQMYMAKDGSLEGLRYGLFKEKVAEVIHSKAKIEKGE